MGPYSGNSVRSTTAGLTGSASHTMSVLSTAWITSASGSTAPFGDAFSSWACYWDSTDMLYSGQGFASGGVFTTYTALTSNVPALQCYVRTDASSSYDAMRVNGRALTRTSANAQTYTSAQINTFGWTSGPSTGYAMTFAILDAPMAAGDQELFEGYEAWGWADVLGSGVLPSGHPYELAPP